MKYREFKEEIEDWGRKHGYATRVSIDYHQTVLAVEFNGSFYFNTSISNRHRFVLDTGWVYFEEIEEHARAEIFSIILQLAKTPIEEREDEKRFIIPLPRLVTTDGKQQYLTHKAHKGCNFFASRRDKDLRQIWQEDELKFLPELYRQFAVEFDEEKEY